MAPWACQETPKALSGAVVQSTSGPEHLLYEPFRFYVGGGRGEHYATSHSPRSIRKSNPGHTATGSRFATSACGSCAPCLVVHAPTLAACAQPPAPGDARHGPSRQGLSQGFRLTGWHVLKAGDWAEAGERWALPLPAPLTATPVSGSASGVSGSSESTAA